MLTALINSNVEFSSIRKPACAQGGSGSGVSDVLPGTTGRRRTEPPSEGAWLVKMTQRVWGVNLKVCSPDVKFKILTQLCLQVAFGWSRPHPQLRPSRAIWNSPRANCCEKNSLLLKMKQNAGSRSALGTQKGVLVPRLVHQVHYLGASLGRSGKGSRMLSTHWPWT